MRWVVTLGARQQRLVHPSKLHRLWGDLTGTLTSRSDHLSSAYSLLEMYDPMLNPSAASPI
jgi:hypothetical protein